MCLMRSQTGGSEAHAGGYQEAAERPWRNHCQEDIAMRVELGGEHSYISKHMQLIALMDVAAAT